MVRKSSCNLGGLLLSTISGLWRFNEEISSDFCYQKPSAIDRFQPQLTTSGSSQPHLSLWPLPMQVVPSHPWHPCRSGAVAAAEPISGALATLGLAAGPSNDQSLPLVINRATYPSNKLLFLLQLLLLFSLLLFPHTYEEKERERERGIYIIFVYLFSHLSIYSFVCLFIHLFMCLCIHPSNSPFI